MKRYIRSIIGILLMIAMLCSGCAKSDTDAKPEGIADFPEYKKLSSVIGLSKEEAQAKLDLQESDLTEEYRYQYDTPWTVEFGGVSFNVSLLEYAYDGHIGAIKYHTEYTGQQDAAAKDILQVANAMGDLIGRKTLWQNCDIFNMTEADLKEKLDDTEGQVVWDLTSVAPAAQKENLTRIMATQNWLSRYKTREALYAMTLKLDYDKNTDTVFLCLYLGVEANIYDGAN